MEEQLKIILLSSGFNGLTQRAWLELNEAGHKASFLLFTNEQNVIRAIENASPDIIICPFLKDRIPDILWQNNQRPIIIIHPGIVGDRGASALDWTIMNTLDTWGVTALQAIEEMDAGPIWSTHEFAVPHTIRKSELYNGLVCDAAMACITDTINAYVSGKKPIPLDYANPYIKGTLQPNMMQTDRTIDWTQPAENIVRIINAAEGVPGVLTQIEGSSMYVYDAHLCPQEGEPGKLLATCNEAILIGTGHQSVWIGSLKYPPSKDNPTFKYPALRVLPTIPKNLPDLSAPFYHGASPQKTYNDIKYHQFGEIGELVFSFYNGAMSTKQCLNAIEAIKFAKAQKTKVLIIRGGWNAFLNGIHLNTIEAADDPKQEAWQNIQAIDDVCLEILTAKQYVIAGLSGSAGAGGVMLAMSADYILAREGIIINPHYGTMGLYGSEYWTYTLPRKIGESKAHAMTEKCLPLSIKQALTIGLIDEIGPRNKQSYLIWLYEAASLALQEKRSKYAFDPQKASECRQRELIEMKEDIFNDRHHFSLKRRCFVFKRKANETPDRLVSNWAMR